MYPLRNVLCHFLIIIILFGILHNIYVKFVGISFRSCSIIVFPLFLARHFSERFLFVFSTNFDLFVLFRSEKRQNKNVVEKIDSMINALLPILVLYVHLVQLNEKKKMTKLMALHMITHIDSLSLSNSFSVLIAFFFCFI